MTIRVVCYAGHKGDERPVRFEVGAKWLDVEEVIDRWYEPNAAFFSVRADDHGIYILRHSERKDRWTLVSFRSPAA